MLDTDVLRSYVAVADTGSFTRAGDLVGRTQSAVSMQMKKLEDGIGKALLVRDKRGVTLTAEGQFLLDQAREILRLTNETLNTLKAPDLSGPLKLGIPEDYAEAWLPPLFRHLNISHPNVQFELIIAESEDLVDVIKKREIDIAIVTAGTGGKDTTLIRNEPLYWVKAEGSNVDMLNPVPVALFRRDCPWRRQLCGHLERIGMPYRIAYTGSGYSGIIGGVMGGLAVTLLPMSALQPGMEVLTEASPLKPPNTTVNISLEVRDNLPKAMSCICDHILAVLGDFETDLAVCKGRVRNKWAA